MLQTFATPLKSREHRWVIGLTGLLLVCIWGFSGFWSWRERTNILSSNTRVLEQLTAAVQAQTQGLFKQAEAILIVASHWIANHPNEDPGTSQGFIELVTKLRNRSGALLDLRVITRTGELRFIPDLGEAQKTNVSDRDYFRAQLNPNTSGFYVGAPIRGRVTGNWVLPISVPVERSGSNITVLLVTIELDRIAETLEAQRIKPAGTIGIARSDGLVLFRSPMDENAIGRSIANGQAWSRYMSAQSRGAYESQVSIFDRLPRLVSFSKLDDFPLVAYVSASKEHLLQSWNFHTTLLGLVAALASIFSLAMCRGLLRSLTSAHLSEAIIQSTDEAILGNSLDGVITSWNSGAERMLGYPASEMLGQDIQCLIPEDRKGEEYEILEKIKRGEFLDHFETARLRKGGRLIDVSVTISPILDSAGRLVGASTIAYDISQRKAAEMQVRESKTRLSGIIASAMDAIISLDKNFDIVVFNGAAERMFGCEAYQMMGQKIDLLIPSSVRTMHSKHMKEFAGTGTTSRTMGSLGQLVARKVTGEEFPIEASISQLHSGGQTIFTVILRNISERLQAQQDLERANIELARSNALLAHSAHFDILTGLPNRVLLADRLDQAIAHSMRLNLSVAVAYLDLDGFKSINDRYGHRVGDDLLIFISERMKSSLREGDTLARVGGDEFIAVLTDLEAAKDCHPILDRLLNSCSEMVSIGDLSMSVSASIGVTIYPQDGADPDVLVRHADQAMYQAKHAGRGKYHLFDVAQDAAIKVVRNAVEQMRVAIEQHQFVLHFQPKVNMRSGQIIGVEALIRWQHPERGLLAPGQFLPAIEDQPISIEIGEWVVSQALKQIAAWRQEDLVMGVSVNISALQLQYDHFVSRLKELLAENSTVDPELLELEILETSALEDIAQVSILMHTIQEMGVRFALDDFGTGYSSLTYLKKLPAEVIKIDQSFVRDMLEDQDDLAIVQGVIGLANAFQREVIAEGVETIQHGFELMKMGCMLAQGYGIARPMPAEDLLKWARSWTPDKLWQQA